MSGLRVPGVEKLMCGSCGDWLRLEDVEGHLNSEGRTLNRREPLDRDDLESIRLALRQLPTWFPETLGKIEAMQAAYDPDDGGHITPPHLRETFGLPPLDDIPTSRDAG